VRQLTELLAAVGVTHAPASDTFSAGTAAAVKTWQKRMGLEPTGVVGKGDVVYVPTLPVRVSLASDLRVGAQLSPGTTTVSTLGAAPDVVLALDAKEAVPPTGAAVTVLAGSARWDAVVADAVPTDDGGAALRLTGPDGGPACGTVCADVPFSSGRITYGATVTVVPEVTGALVPASSVVTDPSGATVVRSDDGELVPVRVLATDGSRLIVSGVAAGDVISLFGDPAASQTSGGPGPGPSQTPGPSS
jgi:peptidoglycan hydrolase-like protein with peptidoglycan-binding domain